MNDNYSSGGVSKFLEKLHNRLAEVSGGFKGLEEMGRELM